MRDGFLPLWKSLASAFRARSRRLVDEVSKIASERERETTCPSAKKMET